MDLADRDALVRLLVQHLAAGSLPADVVVPALRALTALEPSAGRPPSRAELLQAIELQPVGPLEPLRRHLNRIRGEQARAFFEARRSGTPPPDGILEDLADLPLESAVEWHTTEKAVGHAHRLLALLTDRLLLRGAPGIDPAVLARVDAALASSLAAFPGPFSSLFPTPELVAATRGRLSPLPLGPLLDRLGARLRERTELDEAGELESLVRRAQEAPDADTARSLVDIALTWPTDRVALLLPQVCREPWSQDRGALILTLRFGRPWSWDDWLKWLGSAADKSRRAMGEAGELVRTWSVELLLLWELSQGRPDPELVTGLEEWWTANAEAADVDAVAERWGAPRRAQDKPAVAVPEPPRAPARGEAARRPAAESRRPAVMPDAPAGRPSPPAAPAPAPPPEPSLPSLWRDYVQSFLAENWYLVVGLLMVVAGSSLLAYFTWDKHWLLRYTIMPALLASFTASLAGIGSWLEKTDRRFAGTAALLRGTATLLLPVNFMAVALLSQDPGVTRKLVAVPAMAAVYLLVFGWGLRSWCRQVHPALGTFLSGTLLLLNALVTLGPVASAVVSVREDALHTVLGAGFYLGFGALAAAVVHFTRNVLDREMAAERRIPWFVGATLVITYLQVFAWVHTFLRHLPEPQTYAPLAILAGGLVLYVERRFLELRSEGGRHVGESFLGFALVLLGVLMAAGDPELRILAFALAGMVWLRQARGREEPLHHAIGLVFLCLAGASVGLLPDFPRVYLPAIGIALAVGLFGLEAWCARTSQRLLAETAAAVQQVVLLITAVVAVLTQWHFHSEPWLTAVWLLVVAAFFGWRARKGRSLRALVTTMVVLAATLPYLGCVDVLGRSLHGNTMVFGLACLAALWLAFTARSGDELLSAARSTVLWFYGALAFTAMVLRVVIEGARPLDVLWYRTAMDFAGPLIMAAVLMATAYLSRSMLPAWAAVAIVVVLFPELRAHLRITFPGLTWGTGLGSAISAFLLTLIAFPLRRARFLADLGEGDLFLGRDPFPMRRYDARLFTTPVAAAAIFLCAKVDTWNLVRNLALGKVGIKTALALGVVGVTWTVLAVFLRHRKDAVAAVHLGWLSALLAFHYGLAHLPSPPGLQWTFLATGLLLQALELVYRERARSQAWVEPLLRAPTRRVLEIGSLILSAASIGVLLQGVALDRVAPLLGFLGVQLVVRGVLTGHRVYGALLFLLGWTTLLAWTAPGTGPLPERLSIDTSVTATLWLCLAIQLVQLALELKTDLAARLRALLAPAQAGATLLAGLIGLMGLIDVLEAPDFTYSQMLLLLAVVVLVARAHGSGFFALLAAALTYVVVHDPLLRAAGPRFAARMDLLLTPWRWALLALAMALGGALGRLLHERRPRWLVSPLGFRVLRWPATPWIFLPAAALAVLASVHQTISPAMREAPAELWTSYVGAAALAVIAWSWRQTACFALGGILLAVANVHTVRVFLGAPLRARGLSEDHLVCLGLGLTLLQGTLIRLVARRERITAALNTGSLPLATLILVFLCTNYLSEPNLEAIAPLRFVISGAMALLAGLYFRRAALQPGPGETRYVDVCIALYHFGVTLAIWCAALLVPWLRHPGTALIALGVPVFYFYARAEVAWQSADTLALRRYRSSAALLGFVLLGLYVLRAAFQMVFFPDVPIRTDHYHHNAPYLMVLSLVLLRLHGLGGTYWLAFYGGLGLATGSYFTLTMLPGLSPFEKPVAAAWCALAVAHFWTVASYQRSPLRSAVQAMARIEPPVWESLRRTWGYSVLAATHVAVLAAIADWRTDPHLIAPLLLGAASIVVHQGLLRESRLYLLLAAVEVGLALHAGFVVPSYLDAQDVIWVLLGLWALMLAARPFLSRWLLLTHPGPAAAVLAALCFAHVLYHHPSSTTGLWGILSITVLGLLTPCASWRPQTAEQHLLAGLPLLAPAWLVFFSQAPLLEEGVAGALHSWPLLATAATLLGTGWAAFLYQQESFPAWEAPTSRLVRLFDQTCVVMGAQGSSLRLLALLVSFVLAIGVQVVHYARPFAARDLVLFCGLYAAFVVSWVQVGREHRSMAGHALGQLSVLGLFGLVRRQLTLTTDFWTPEKDVWLSLLVSIGLTGAKPWLDRQAREARLPALVPLFALPAAALFWTWVNHLGSDMALLVVGLYSLMFAFLGREERDSPYNVIAVSGFVAFVLIVFWSKLELRVVHAYVIPVGLGVLALLQLFGKAMDPGTRNRVRAVTLLAMLGSSAYYALVDDRQPLAFNVTLLLLCLGAMVLGSLLRVRLYLTLGSTGVVVDLASIVVKALLHMDRGPRMTAVGVLVLLLGTLLVVGAVYYKTHRDELAAQIEAWRGRLGEWE